MSGLYIPQHGLNIERSNLPQIQSKDMPDFIHWLRTHKHAAIVHTELPVASLYPSQGNFNQTKIKAFMGKEKSNLKKPIVVSGDHFVLDGHHRWLALLNMDKLDTIPVILVHMKIMDLLAAAREYPKSTTKSIVESFKSLVEAKEVHKVLAFGRMNPPTTGHEKLVNKVHEVAKAHGASHEVVLSHSQDAKKNPLSQAQKIKHAKRFFPGTNVTGASKDAPTLFHHAAKAHKAGVQHLHVVMGGDRVKEFHDALHKHNGKFDKEGHGYKFKSITVHSAGHRDPDAKGTEGMSASKMREHAGKGNYNEFKKGIPGHVKPEHAKELYHDVRKSMGHLHEELEMLSEGVHDAGIFKAVFMAGAPGSGKDFVMKKSLMGHGLTEINSDHALEFLMDKNKLDKKMPEHEQEKRNTIRDKAKSLTELRQRLALHGRNGLIINSTGADIEKIKRIKGLLDDLGYDSKMVFVDTSDNVSRQRNIERGQRGGRMIPEKIRVEKYRQAQDARVKFAKLFGGEHYHEFNNDVDLRVEKDPGIHDQKNKELTDLFKKVRKFTETPPQHPAAQEWIHTNLGKLAKQPVGNKKQQSSTLPAANDSAASEEARKLGLTYMGYGRYGKGGRVTHFALHGRLIEKRKALTPPKTQEAPKQQAVNEAFEQLLMEDEHGTVRLGDNVEGDLLVGESEIESQHVVERPERQIFESFRRMPGMYGTGTGTGRCGIPAFRDRVGSGRGEAEEEKESLVQEEANQEKVSFQAFKRTLAGRLVESSPIRDTGDQGDGGGPILGMPTGGNETIDIHDGGKATKGPKKSLKKLRTDIK